MDGLQIVVCGSIVPDPLQTLEPVQQPNGQPGIKNEMMLPAVLDPWAGHALYEAANLAKSIEKCKVYLVTIGPKAKVQQVMMTIAQKVPFDLVAMDGPANGFTDSATIAEHLEKGIRSIPDLEMSNLLVFGGWESASRGSSTTMQFLGERLGIFDQFQGVDELEMHSDDSFTVLERVEGGKHQVSTCQGLPAVIGWATGTLPEPPNNPQVGMVNMRTVMPSLQKAQPVQTLNPDIQYKNVQLPSQKRETRIEKDLSEDQIAQEIVEWIKK